MLKEEVDEEDVARIVSKWTGIPVSRMLEGEVKKLITMEDRLRQRVVGQDEAIERVSNAIRRSRAGLSDPRRPIGSLLRTEPVCIVERGAPASKILEVAEAHGADLIMLGIQDNNKNFGKHLLRPGIFQIVAGATCPVLMVRR